MMPVQVGKRSDLVREGAASGGRWLMRWALCGLALWLCVSMMASCGSSSCKIDSDCTNGGQCVFGSCVICQSGKSVCVGVCRDLRIDPTNCGDCGRQCLGSETCRDGQCVSSDCSNPLYPKRCGESCVNLQAEISHCGGCNKRCKLGQLCQKGACGCPNGRLSCNGACVDVFADARHCGACGRACPRGKVCSEGRCVTQCPTSRTNCFDGCVDVQRDPYHCGSCGAACEPLQLCIQGKCGCPSGRVACEGACVDTQTSWSHCGGCGKRCQPGQLCAAGKCVPSCPAATSTPCFGGCFDLKTSLYHCGACGNQCGQDQRCVDGACTCSDGLTACGDRCVDTQSNVRHCGSCDNACDEGLACDAGVCAQPSCQASETLCGSLCVDTSRDQEHCGRCGNACPAGQSCQQGQCAAQANCQEGETLCGALCCSKGQSCCEGACTSTPEPEVCDGKDNDCNGKIDDNTSDSGKACVVADALGPCGAGTQACVGGQLRCEQSVKPAKEICNNGIDEDCDGKPDNGCKCPTNPQDRKRPCYSGPAGTQSQGSCQAGEQTCTDPGGWGACTGEITPKAETCNGKDDDCDGQIDEQSGAGAACQTGQKGRCAAGTERCQGGKTVCVRSKGPIAESCNGVDDDCDGSTDEGVKRSCYTGPSGTANQGLCRSGTETCSGGKWGACTGEITPKAEACDGKDNDCNGQIDDDPKCVCTNGSTRTCGSGTGACQKGTQTCQSGAWGTCVGRVSPTSEKCDGIDNDCDGQIDENWSNKGSACSAGTGACRRTGTYVCNSAQTGTKCSATAGSPSTETCNGKDDDCDGQTDENLQRSCYTGPSGTQGVGRCRAGQQSCSTGSWGACTGELKPKTETCNTVDDDCDGQTDEVCTCTQGQSRSCGTDTGECKKGTQSCTAQFQWGTCSGTGPVSEKCNGKDDDCDGSTDENWSNKGNSCSVGTGACRRAGTYVCNAAQTGTTCSATAGSPSTETCNGIDDDCDGSVDENIAPRACYTGSSSTRNKGICQDGTQACVNGGWSSSCLGQVLPSAESCNGKDDDCDGSTDEGLNGGTCYYKFTVTCTRGSSTCVNGVFRCTNGQSVSCLSNSQCSSCPTKSRSCVSGLCGGPEP